MDGPELSIADFPPSHPEWGVDAVGPVPRASACGGRIPGVRAEAEALAADAEQARLSGPQCPHLYEEADLPRALAVSAHIPKSEGFERRPNAGL